MVKENDYWRENFRRSLLIWTQHQTVSVLILAVFIVVAAATGVGLAIFISPSIGVVVGLLLGSWYLLLLFLVTPRRMWIEQARTIEDRDEQIRILTEPRLVVTNGSGVGDRGHHWIRLRVTNPTSGPIPGCYGKLRKYRVLDGAAPQGLPDDGQAYPWSSRGGDWEHSRTIPAMSSDYLDIARSTAVGEQFVNTYLKSVDPAALRLTYQWPLNPGRYEAEFEIGSTEVAMAPTLVYLDMLLNVGNQWARTMVGFEPAPE